MKDQNSGFDHRKLLREEGVEDDAKSHDGPDEQRSVPTFEDVGVRMIQDDQPLNDGADNEGKRSETNLPSED